MDITIKTSLNTEERKEVWDFLKEFRYVPYHQFPEYPSIEGLKATAFIARKDKQVIGWVQVIEKGSMLAAIEFGPLAINESSVSALLIHVVQHYRKKFFFILRWMPYWYTPSSFEQICAQAGAKVSFINAANLRRWSSRRISLSDSGEIILKKFSENHRRNIKKAMGLQLKCEIIKDNTTIKMFADGYVNMYQHRNLKINNSDVMHLFTKLHEYFQETGKGFFIGAFKEDVLLGGIVMIYQGDTALYYKGYINHEQRQMPINHVVFYNAILFCKEDKMQWFDLGGYAADTKNDQLININKFKDGFRGEPVNFPESKIIGLNLLSKMAYLALSLKNKLSGV